MNCPAVLRIADTASCDGMSVVYPVLTDDTGWIFRLGDPGQGIGFAQKRQDKITVQFQLAGIHHPDTAVILLVIIGLVNAAAPPHGLIGSGLFESPQHLLSADGIAVGRHLFHIGPQPGYIAAQGLTATLYAYGGIFLFGEPQAFGAGFPVATGHRTHGHAEKQ